MSETLKEKIQFHWKHNKTWIIIVGIAWKLLATMIMVEKCKWPEDLSVRQWTEESWKMEQDGTYVKIDTLDCDNIDG